MIHKAAVLINISRRVIVKKLKRRRLINKSRKEKLRRD
jgi:hypothetical protein